MSATRRRDQVVILRSLDPGAQSVTRISSGDVLGLITGAIRAAFCENAVTMAMLATVAVMIYHIVTVEDNIAMGKAVALDMLRSMPWALILITRRMKEGGEL